MISPSSAADTAGKARLLLIEDNQPFALLIQKYLEDRERCRFEVVWVQTLAEGIAELSRGGIDVVLLDLSLPDSMGMETFAKVQSRWGHVPVLILTGHDCDEQAMEAVRRGAQDYLVKTRINADGLSRAVCYGIERNRALRQLSDQAQSLRSQNEQMHFELELAQQIQHALLPRDEPATNWQVSHRYLPCNGLAGDFFQVFPLDEDRIGILICDVMGHGVRSALAAALIRGLIEEEEARLDNPGQLLTRLNGLLATNLWKRGIEMFATACYLVADPRRGTVTCANAGHPFPFELNPGSQSVAPLQASSGGMALGILEEVEYQSQTFAFDPENRLFLYTDGICEVNDDQDDFFAGRIPDRLKERMSDGLDHMLEGLIADARGFSGRDEFADDICLVGLQYS